jgi:hypothetical protein
MISSLTIKKVGKLLRRSSVPESVHALNLLSELYVQLDYLHLTYPSIQPQSTTAIAKQSYPEKSFSIKIRRPRAQIYPAHRRNMAEASSSRINPDSTPAQPLPQPTDDGAISIHLPTSFLVLPPVAGLIGLGIGMSRGGSRARLRFLAENAHRPPTTYRGWVSHLTYSKDTPY